jgi:hypothetical protein
VPVDVAALLVSNQEADIAEITKIRIYNISLPQGGPLYGMASSTMYFSNIPIYTQQYSSYFYTGSTYFSDSVIQAYYTQLFIAYTAYNSVRASAIDSLIKLDSLKPDFRIISFSLNNPQQDITLGTGTGGGGGMGSSAGGGGIGSSNMCSGANSGSDASLLQSLRNILCI